ncbi:MAG: glycine--tRNA ligase subunit beta, partial [Caldisericaceae bacterium]
SNFEFIRPIKNILALFGDELVEVSIGNLKSNRETFGFFFDTPSAIELSNTEDYMKKLKENYIVLAFSDRAKIVEKRSKEIASAVGGVPKYNEAFFEEVVNLNEYPVPFLCNLDIGSVNIPDCITESVVKNHMKSFPVTNKSGKLLPYFVAVKNGPSDFVDIVRSGYERVAKARLLDGLFFYEEDKKFKLAELAPNLSGIVFTKDLGTMLDKTERLVNLAESLSQMIGLRGSEALNLARAAYLSKADLLTNVQKEFPELQGTIGGIYARSQGEADDVASAISEQYFPTYQGDRLPSSFLGKMLSLIDRVDTLTGSIMSGVAFSSSKDPFGLRRIASGIVQILSDLDRSSFPIAELVGESARLFREFNPSFKDGSDEVISILKDRALFFLKDSGIRYDVANAVVAVAIDYLPSYFDRAQLLMRQIDTDKLLSICQMHRRVANILGSSSKGNEEIREDLLIDWNERDLYEAVKESEKLADELAERGDNEAVIQMLYLITPIVNKFFDNVLIMDKDESVKENRLALLRRLKKLMEQFANFSEIVFDNK